MNRLRPADASSRSLDGLDRLPEVGSWFGIRVVVNEAVPEDEVHLVSSTGDRVRLVNVGTKESRHGRK